MRTISAWVGGRMLKVERAAQAENSLRGMYNPTATVVEHALLTQGFRGVSKVPFPRLFRPQNRDSTWENLANAPK